MFAEATVGKVGYDTGRPAVGQGHSELLPEGEMFSQSGPPDLWRILVREGFPHENNGVAWK